MMKICGPKREEMEKTTSRGASLLVRVTNYYYRHKVNKDGEGLVARMGEMRNA
jgi:hypothetical protein